MFKRPLLRSQFRESWKTTIRKHYAKGLINSESGLQVHFCIELLRCFKRDGVWRQIFVEPAIRFERHPVLYPDLVVCNTRNIIGVVEFKYVPRTRPKLKKDMSTLQLFGNSTDSVEITLERYRGKKINSRNYPIVKDAILCWAGVYSGKRVVFPNESLIDIGARFMQLHALTSEGKDAKILPRNSKR